MRYSLLIVVLISMTACARQAEPPAVQDSPAVAQPISAAVWLDQARTAHAAGELARLSALAASDAPSAMTAEDAASVKRGLYAHAAKLALAQGLAQDAERLVREGLALPGEDPLRTQLLLQAIEIARTQHDAAGEATARQQARAALRLD